MRDFRINDPESDTEFAAGLEFGDTSTPKNSILIMSAIRNARASGVGGDRRTTRASSRAASSRGPSPAIDEQDIPATPSSRRASTRRAISSQPLPQVGLRTSSAYGTNQISQAASLRAPSGQENITSALGSILEPLREEEDSSSSRGGRGRGHVAASSTPSAASIGPHGRRGRNPFVNPASPGDRSFQLESGIFAGAMIESSSIAESDEHAGIPEYPVTPEPVRESAAQRQERETIEELARRTRVTNTQQQKFQRDRDSKWWFERIPYLKQILLGLFFLSLAIWARNGIISGVSTALSLPGNLASWLVSGSGPRLFDKDEVGDLQRRMKSVEMDITRIKKRADIDGNTIQTLRSILPPEIAVKKDSNGEIEILDDFWHALRDKIRSDDSLLQKDIGKGSSVPSSKGGISSKEVTNIAERVVDQSDKVWNKFLEANKQKIIQWGNDDFSSKISEHLRDYVESHHIVSRDEFLDGVKKNWEDTREEIQVHLRPIAKQLENSLAKIHKIEQQKTIGEPAVRKISHDVAEKLIANAKLAAASDANIEKGTRAAIQRVNHFSPGTGAVIDPVMTSPNYMFPSMDRNRFVRGLFWAAGRPIPNPNPASVALKRWEEFGDCWCSPTKNSDGFGPSLAVITQNIIIPDQVTIEHIASSASMEPGSAPKDMELLAFIQDVATYHHIRRKTSQVFSNEELEEPAGKAGWVRLGVWRYDSTSPIRAQTFTMQISLKSFEGPAFTNNLIVRAKNNWGGEAEVPYTCLYRVRVHGQIVKDIPKTLP